MPSIDDIAAEYVERAAALDPCYATYAGIAGHHHELADLGADGFAGRAGLDRSTLAALDAAEAPEPREQVARAAMRERLALAVECYDAGDTTSELNTISSWVQRVREVFDLMPAEGEEAAASIARRMAAVPRAYRQLSATLLDAARDGRCAARRQVEEVAGQCAAWARPGDSFYSGLTGRLTAVPDSLRGEAAVAARAATAATAGLGAFLDGELMPLAPEKDACGPEVYARASRYFLGAAVDLREAYAWSWEEIARLRAEMARVSNLVRPGATVEEAAAILDQDPARRVEGRELPCLDAGTGRAHHFGAARGTGWREGERWNAEIGWEFLRAHSSWDERQLRSELRRCLGMPGQAPSYTLGERIWLQAREDAMARAGRTFSLKDFHAGALSLGAMGLDPLREALARV